MSPENFVTPDPIAVSNNDFDVEAKFLTQPAQESDFQGLRIEEAGTENYISFNISYSDGEQNVNSALISGGRYFRLSAQTVPTGSANYLRAIRTGEEMVLQYSADGLSWTTAADFEHNLNNINQVAVTGGNEEDGGYTFQVESFQNNSGTPTENVAPVATNDSATVEPGTAVGINVLGNDTDSNGNLDENSITLVSQPANGTISVNADGTVTYTHDGSATTSDSFTYTVSDSEGAISNPATVALAIAANQAPTANDDNASVVVGNSVIVNVLANDSDPEGRLDATSLVLTGQPSSGSATTNSDGTIAYTHDGSATTSDSFTYQVADNNGVTSSPATVSLTVTPPPVGQNNPDPIAVSNNDFDVEAKFLTQPAQESDFQGLRIEEAGTENYISFNISYSDGEQNVNSALISGGRYFRLSAQTVPTGSANYLRAIRTGEEMVLQYSADGLSWTTAADFEHNLNNINQVAVTGGNEEDGGYTFQVESFQNNSGTPTENVAPVATNDSATVEPGTAVGINVLGNDTDSNGNLDENSITLVSQPANGTISVNADGTVTYTHDGSATTSDSFTYTVSDSEGAISNPATVALAIAANQAPTANDDNASVVVGNSVIVNVLANDSDPEGRLDATSLVLTGQPSSGSATTNSDGTIAYTHDGSATTSDSFTYQVADNNGVTSSPATVSLTVTPPPVGQNNPDPIAVSNNDFDVEAKFLTQPAQESDFQGLRIEEAGTENYISFNISYSDGEQNVNSALISGGRYFRLSAQTVPTGSANYLRAIRTGEEMVLQYSADGLSWTTAADFEHNLNNINQVAVTGGNEEDGGYTFQVESFQNNSGTPTENVAPVATNDSATVEPGTAVGINVLGNDTDSNGNLDENSITLVSQPANGTISVNADGTVTYTHDGSATTNDSFTYQVADDDGELSNVATVNLSIGTSVSNGPVIDLWQGQVQTFGQGGRSQNWVNILGEVNDVDGVTSLTYSLNGGSNIPLNFSPNGLRLANEGDFNVDIAYSDLDGSAVDDFVTITAVDGEGDISTETVTVKYETPPASVETENYSINWASVTDIQNVGQAIDGRWALVDRDNNGSNDGLDILEPGYDRLFGFGDIAWDNYEVEVPITMNQFNLAGGSGIGLLLRWNGHTANSEDPDDLAQPIAGFSPLGAIGWYTGESLEVFADGGKADVSRNLEEGKTYVFKMRVEDIEGASQTIYSLKVWEQGQLEPELWDVQQTSSKGPGSDTGPESGGAALITHRHQVTFGDVTVTSLESDNPSSVRINAGGLQDYTDLLGREWIADAFYTGNKVFRPGLDSTADTNEADLYGSERFGTSFSYSIPVSNGNYTVNLSWLENFHSAGERLIDVSIENQLVLDNLDVFSEVGLNTLLTKRFQSIVVTDGELNIDFQLDGQSVDTNAFVLSLEVFPDSDSTLGSTFVGDTSNNTISGSSGNDVLIGVDPVTFNAGQGEIDRLTGLGGKDTFELGDAAKAYYDDGLANDVGFEDYALITDFDITQQDVIRLFGSAADYVLGDSPGGLPDGQAIYYQSNGQENELIGVIEGIEGLTLNSPSFEFV